MSRGKKKAKDFKSDPLKCGDCGNDQFRIFHHKPTGNECRVGGGGQGEVEGSLYVVCTNCKEGSTIDVMPPQLRVDGNLCGGWSGG